MAGDGLNLTYKDIAELDTITGATGADYIIVIKSGVPKKCTIANAKAPFKT